MSEESEESGDEVEELVCSAIPRSASRPVQQPVTEAQLQEMQHRVRVSHAVIQSLHFSMFESPANRH